MCKTVRKQKQSNKPFDNLSLSLTCIRRCDIQPLKGTLHCGNASEHNTLKQQHSHKSNYCSDNADACDKFSID